MCIGGLQPLLLRKHRHQWVLGSARRQCQLARCQARAPQAYLRLGRQRIQQPIVLVGCRPQQAPIFLQRHLQELGCLAKHAGTVAGLGSGGNAVQLQGSSKGGGWERQQAVMPCSSEATSPMAIQETCGSPMHAGTCASQAVQMVLVTHQAAHEIGAGLASRRRRRQQRTNAVVLPGQLQDGCGRWRKASSGTQQQGM